MKRIKRTEKQLDFEIRNNMSRHNTRRPFRLRIKAHFKMNRNIVEFKIKDQFQDEQEQHQM